MPGQSFLLIKMPPVLVSIMGDFFLGCFVDTIFLCWRKFENQQSDEPVMASYFALSIMGLLLMLPSRLPLSSVKPYWGC